MLYAASAIDERPGSSQEVPIEASDSEQNQRGIKSAGIVLLIAVVGIFIGCSDEETAQQPVDDEQNSTPVAGYEVQPQDLSKAVRVSGTIEPREWLYLKSYESGILTTLNVEEGDVVEEDQLLASTELAQYRAELRRAQAQVARLEQELERKEPLLERQAIQESEIDNLRADIAVAESEVDIWQTRISLGELRAPTEAVVTERYVDPGSSVAANEEVLQLARVSTLLLPVRMSERDVVELERDQSVEVTIDAYPHETLEAEIRRIFPAADPDSRRITVELALAEIPEHMDVKPGFRARATVDVDRREAMIAVPGESLLASEGENQFVYVIEDDRLVERSVQTGVDRRNWTEITEGLDDGDIIVGTNPTNLREGTRVHVSQWVGTGQ